MVFAPGPVDLTVGSLFLATNSSNPTDTHNLLTHGVTPAGLASASFHLIKVPSIKEGGLRLALGRIDSTKFTELLIRIRTVCGLQTGTFIADLNPRGQITRKNLANRNWGIGQSIWYGTSPVPIMDIAAGTVDTGNTLILLVTGTSFYWIRVLYNRANNLKHPIFVDTFDCYRRASGEVVEPTTKLLRITPARYANLKSLLTIGDRTFELTAHPQIWSGAFNERIGE